MGYRDISDQFLGSRGPLQDGDMSIFYAKNSICSLFNQKLAWRVIENWDG
jgi:hypothetical protein